MSTGFGFNQNFTTSDLGSGAGFGGGFNHTWLPNELPLCKLWLRGDMGITLNGGNVSSWADQSGLGNNFTQATALNQPLYVPSNINNQPGLRFNGTTHKMVGPVFGSVISTASGYWFAVIRPISITLNSTIVYANDGIFSDSGADYGLALRNGQGLSAYNYTGAYASTAYQPVTNGVAYLMGWDHQSGTLKCWLGSSSRSVASGNTTGAISAIQLGSCQGIRYLHADVCEIVAGKAGLSAANLSLLQQYFASRYNITL